MKKINNLKELFNFYLSCYEFYSIALNYNFLVIINIIMNLYLNFHVIIMNLYVNFHLIIMNMQLLCALIYLIIYLDYYLYIILIF